MLVCQICGFTSKNNLVSHISRKHHIPPKIYKELYNSPVLTNDTNTRKKISDSVRKNGGGVNSKKYWIHKGYSEEEAIKLSKENSRKNSKRCIEFWTSRGYTIDEAKVKISELQSTIGKRQSASKHKWIELGYSLEDAQKIAKNHLSKKSLLHVNYWMERHGLSESEAQTRVSEIQRVRSVNSSRYKGKISTPERNKKISESIKQKIMQVGAEEWSMHFGKFYGRSLLEEEVFQYVKSLYGDANNNVWLDSYNIDILVGNKIIEVFGDYWHANPNVLSLKRKPKEYTDRMELIRENDEARLNYIRNKGFSVLVVWENDWRNNLEKTKQVIQEFLG
jgi:hypothetical protein